jgi:hypothetical protein
LNTVFWLTLNDLKRDWKRPWTVLLYAALPLVMATLISLVFGGGGGSASMPTIHVAVLDQDKDMLSHILRALPAQGDSAKNLRLHFVDTREEGVRLLEERQASAFVLLPPHMTDYLLQGRTNVIEFYENPAQQILPRVVRMGTSLTASVLSGAAEVVGEPLTEVRELIRSDEFPAEALVTGAASSSWSKLRNVRGYLFPPLVKFETVAAADYRIGSTNQP